MPSKPGSRRLRAGLSPAAARRESARSRRHRVLTLLERLEQAYPESHCALDHHSPLELLVATILSAQCTDKRVNEVTPALFRRYPSAAHYAQAPLEEIETLIRSTGFFRNKARSLQGLGRALVADHDGEVPRAMALLTPLPGVGRKTANVVLGNAFGENLGVVVDTHVGRLSRRLGLTEHDDPVKVERDLMAVVPQPRWTLWSHLLIDHGRAVCLARKPRCSECMLQELCPAAEV